MARQPNPTPVAIVDNTRADVLQRDAHSLAVMSEHSRQIADQFGDGTPYDQARVVSEARFYLGQSAEAMLEAGKRLVLLKENEPHGEFVAIVEKRLGMNTRTAQKMMQAAVKFLAPTLASKASAPTLLSLGRTKLLELVSEPDEAIEALAEGGTVAGLDLDEIQAMSSRELRAALLEARQAAAAKDKVIAKKDQKLNALAEKEEIRRTGRPDEREAAQLAELRDTALAAELNLQALLTMVDEVTQNPATEAAELAARQTLDYIVQRIADGCAERGLAVDVLGERVEPGWSRPITDAVETYAATKPAKPSKTGRK
jgi:hypothetical protein